LYDRRQRPRPDGGRHAGLFLEQTGGPARDRVAPAGLPAPVRPRQDAAGRPERRAVLDGRRNLPAARGRRDVATGNPYVQPVAGAVGQCPGPADRRVPHGCEKEVRVRAGGRFGGGRTLGPPRSIALTCAGASR
ncbi:conserved hypothetical protein, partial [Ricinus communis]